ncbi:MAG TPA: metalloregulator ArsR/SmtB family transcription factor [Candidatus Hydrogenedentes bacterium]|nr:metalloregulator ArsR/SmtB family transcription factor [Candidatus Hydrogenedentota bacterium]HNT87404.1 metalloregulator ArsR/SmtB family transcription factor [Candidatus Hydrogenedentota bacterium]
MEIQDAIRALAALAQETRLAVFRLLVRAGPDGMPAGAIAETLGAPPATLSFHLSHLHDAGLLERRRYGRSLWYSVDFAGFRTLVEYLQEDCCQGRAELCGTPPSAAARRSKPGCAAGRTPSRCKTKNAK